MGAASGNARHPRPCPSSWAATPGRAGRTGMLQQLATPQWQPRNGNPGTSNTYKTTRRYDTVFFPFRPVLNLRMDVLPGLLWLMYTDRLESGVMKVRFGSTHLLAPPPIEGLGLRRWCAACTRCIRSASANSELPREWNGAKSVGQSGNHCLCKSTGSGWERGIGW